MPVQEATTGVPPRASPRRPLLLYCVAAMLVGSLVALALISSSASHSPIATPPVTLPNLGSVVAQVPACSRYASLAGSDNASGSASRPVRSVARLVSLLRPGMTGCLVGGGIFREGALHISESGVSGRPITIRSAGRTAAIHGDVTVYGSHVVLRGLVLDGDLTSRASPFIVGSDVALIGDSVTSHHRGICILVGGDHPARHTVIAYNRIHDCGRLPATGFDHGIYVENSIGAVIDHNLIYRNADYGIQLYPNAQSTVVTHNIIDQNGRGVIIAGADGRASSGSLIAANIISNPSSNAAVQGWWPPGNPVGTHNVVTGNCLWTTGRVPSYDGEGFTVAAGNRRAQPRFVDARAGDYRLTASSPCRDLNAG
jgi:parallel beta-helix repeat protein